MKIKIIEYIKIYNTYLYITLGFLLLIYHIWFRFIRTRLPRDIPFDLSLLSLILLCIIIGSFIFVLKQYIKPIVSDFRLYVIKMYKPFILFDAYIRKKNYFKVVIKTLFKLFFKVLFYKDQYPEDSPNIINTYFTWAIIPRGILLILFIIDTIYLDQLYLIYIFAFLGFIPLIFTYFIYLMKVYREEYIVFLEEWYEVEEIPKEDFRHLRYDGHNYTMIRTFLDMQEIYLDYDPIEYKCGLTWKVVRKYFPFPDVLNMDDLTKEQRDIIEKDFYDYIRIVISMNHFLFNYEYDIKRMNKEIQLFNVGVYSLYLICWSYILIISLPNFHLTDLEIIFLNNFQDLLEPFSQLIINYDEQQDNK